MTAPCPPKNITKPPTPPKGVLDIPDNEGTLEVVQSACLAEELVMHQYSGTEAAHASGMVTHLRQQIKSHSAPFLLVRVLLCDAAQFSHVPVCQEPFLLCSTLHAVSVTHWMCTALTFPLSADISTFEIRLSSILQLLHRMTLNASCHSWLKVNEPQTWQP